MRKSTPSAKQPANVPHRSPDCGRLAPLDLSWFGPVSIEATAARSERALSGHANPNTARASAVTTAAAMITTSRGARNHASTPAAATPSTRAQPANP